MGCGVSVSDAIGKGTGTFRNATWKKKRTKAESLEIYRNEGSIPKNCSDSVLECRVSC